MADLDWDDVRFFLAVARANSLSAAAKTLGVDQTTVGRRLAALEESVGQRLFERTPTGLAPTPAARRMIKAAEAMADAAGDFGVASRSDEAAVAEVVRVATTDSLAERFIIPALRGVRASAPHVDVTILTGWATVNLLRGEADLAVRLVRPTHPRLVARKLADFALRAYASPEYVAARGAPGSDFRDHDVIAYTEALVASTQLTIAGLDASEARVALRTNSGRALMRAACDGVGVTELPSYVGDLDERLVRVCCEHERRYAVYLVTHEDRRRARSVRAVCDAISDMFEASRRAQPRTARVRRVKQ